MDGEFADPIAYYYLWRRVEGGATRRITGAAEPDDPGCVYDARATVVTGRATAR